MPFLLSVVLTKGHFELAVFWAFCPVVVSLLGFVSVGCCLYMDYTSHWSTCGTPHPFLLLCPQWSPPVSSLTHFPPSCTICPFPNLAEDDGNRFLSDISWHTKHHDFMVFLSPIQQMPRPYHKLWPNCSSKSFPIRYSLIPLIDNILPWEPDSMTEHHFKKLSLFMPWKHTEGVQI